MTRNSRTTTKTSLFFLLFLLSTLAFGFEPMEMDEPSNSDTPPSSEPGIEPEVVTVEHDIELKILVGRILLLCFHHPSDHGASTLTECNRVYVNLVNQYGFGNVIKLLNPSEAQIASYGNANRDQDPSNNIASVFVVAHSTMGGRDSAPDDVLEIWAGNPKRDMPASVITQAFAQPAVPIIWFACLGSTIGGNTLPVGEGYIDTTEPEDHLHYYRVWQCYLRRILEAARRGENLNAEELMRECEYQFGED